VVQQLHEAWRDAYLNKRPGAKKVDLTSVPQVEVLIRVRDLPAEEAANVWTKVRGGDLFLPGVIQRLRLLEQATSPTSSPTSATRAGDLFVVRYGSRPMATPTCPKKAHLQSLGDAKDGIVVFSILPTGQMDTEQKQGGAHAAFRTVFEQLGRVCLATEWLATLNRPDKYRR
jgi:hypothetical protein